MVKGSSFKWEKLYLLIYSLMRFLCIFLWTLISPRKSLREWREYLWKFFRTLRRRRRKKKLGWNTITISKSEGGFGIRDLWVTRYGKRLCPLFNNVDVLWVLFIQNFNIVLQVCLLQQHQLRNPFAIWLKYAERKLLASIDDYRIWTFYIRKV